MHCFRWNNYKLGVTYGEAFCCDCQWSQRMTFTTSFHLMIQIVWKNWCNLVRGVTFVMFYLTALTSNPKLWQRLFLQQMQEEVRSLAWGRWFMTHMLSCDCAFIVWVNSSCEMQFVAWCIHASSMTCSSLTLDLMNELKLMIDASERHQTISTSQRNNTKTCDVFKKAGNSRQTIPRLGNPQCCWLQAWCHCSWGCF